MLGMKIIGRRVHRVDKSIVKLNEAKRGNRSHII